jgi:hypothetical protein
MASRLALAVLGAFSISLLAMGAGQAAVCDPHCAPTTSNQGGAVTGLNRANEVAGDHGRRGRDNAAAKQDLHKPGGSGVDSGGSTGGTTDGGGTTGGTTGGGTTPGPCTGC